MKESDTIWGAMAYGVEQFSDRGSEALANFFNGTKTGFREMTASILFEMEKLIIKQQLLKPVMDIAMAGLESMFSGSTYNSIYNSNTADMSGQMGGDSYIPYPVRESNLGMQSKTTVASNITVNVSPSGQVSSEVSGQGGAELGRMIEGAVLQVIEKQHRPGGYFNRVAGRH